MAFDVPARTVAVGNPPQSDHQIDQTQLADWMETVETLLTGFTGTYASQAAAIATEIDSGVSVIRFVHRGRLYGLIRDAGGNITTADGGTWAPERDATPVHWGAVGDGSTDDAPAFASMFDWVMGNGNFRKILLPENNTFAVESQYVTTADPYDGSESNGIEMVGQGKSSIIKIKNSDGFFKWTQSSGRDISAQFVNFGILLANDGSNGVPIWLEQSAPGLSRHTEARFERIDVFPEDITGNYAVAAFRVKNMFFATFTECNLNSNFETIREKMYQSRFGIDVSGSYGWRILNTRIWGCRTCVHADEPNFVGGEGGEINGGILDGDVGLYAFTPGAEPAITIDNVAFNCGTRSVWLDGRKAGDISKNTWFMQVPQYTNWVPYSHDQASWNVSGSITVSASPDQAGFRNWQTVSDNDGASEPNINVVTDVVANGTQYCVSAVLMKGSAAKTLITCSSASNVFDINIDWNLAGVPTVTANGTGNDLEGFGAFDMGDGAWLVYGYGTTDAAEALTVRLYPAGFTAGGGPTGTVLVEHIQFNEGAVARTPVVTGAAKVTAVPTDIYLKNCTWIGVHDIKFWWDGTPERVNLHVADDCDYILAHHNMHNSADTAYQWDGAGANDTIDTPIYGPLVTTQLDGGASVTVK